MFKKKIALRFSRSQHAEHQMPSVETGIGVSAKEEVNSANEAEKDNK